MTRFDRYVVVDWSAASRPVTGADSIWIAVLDDRATPELVNPPTRAEAASVLRELRRPDRRTLLAVDASLGYPSGTASWFGLAARPPWQAMWGILSDLLSDGPDNRNNRFDVADALNRRGGGESGPFWGRPAARDLAALSVTKPPAFPLGEFRRCELALRARGSRPASGWQLLGAGSVGSQTLTLLPLLAELLAEGGVEIWPFTTGPSPRALAPGEVLVVETWPTLFAVDVPVGAIRDAAQVDAVATALRTADRGHRLDEWFTIDLIGEDLAAVVDEEGWILGPTPIFEPGARDCGAGS